MSELPALNGALARFNAGRAARKAGDITSAIVCFRQALSIQPDHVPALNNLATALQAQGEIDEALQVCRRAHAHAPDKPVVLCNLGSLLQVKGEPEQARQAYEQAIRLQPGFGMAHHNLARLAGAQGQFEQADAAYRRALELLPQDAILRLDYGDLCQSCGNLTRAINLYRAALRLQPSARGFNSLGAALQGVGQLDLARKSYRRALSLDPGFALAARNLAGLHDELGELGLARQYYERELERSERRLHEATSPSEAVATVSTTAPDVTPRAQLALQLARLMRKQADWERADERLEQLRTELEDHLKHPPAAPLPVLSALEFALPPSLLRELAISQADSFERLANNFGVRFEYPDDPVPQRLRIGYVSPDLRQHAVGTLVAGLFKHHTRPDFEIFAYSLTPTNDALTDQVRAGCDHFSDVSQLAPLDLARRIHADGIHILVDLAGYTTMSRTLVMALRPAPVQLQYLGYPGTMGAAFLPAMLADAQLVPEQHEARYTEQVLRLPNAWATELPQVPPTCQTRAEVGLPERGVVYCCHNAVHKIDSMVFAQWMRILQAVPGSVLWLLDGEASGSNDRLALAAQAAGVDPQRLVFAPRRAHDEYLAQYRLADLFLDTPAYNAGATAVGALAAGLPVLTCPGEHYATRMGASLCAAVGMPELICADAQAYEQRSIDLGLDACALAALKSRLLQALPVAPLFQPHQFMLNLERVYRDCWARHRANTPAALVTPRSGGGQ